MPAGLFSFLVGLFQEGLGRVENEKEVWLGSKTGNRFGSGRKQEGGLGRVENTREVWVGLKTGGRLYRCTYDPLWRNVIQWPIISCYLSSNTLLWTGCCSSVFKQKNSSFKGVGISGKFEQYFSSNNGLTTSCWFQENLLSAWSLLTRSLAFLSHTLLPCSLALFTVFTARLATPMTTFYPQAKTKAQCGAIS